jgi:hypothetical protein
VTAGDRLAQVFGFREAQRSSDLGFPDDGRSYADSRFLHAGAEMPAHGGDIRHFIGTIRSADREPVARPEAIRHLRH